MTVGAQLALLVDTRPFHASLKIAARHIRRVALHFLAMQYGAPPRLGLATPWHEIGRDSCRMLFVMETEQRFGIEVTDEDREGVQTFGDFLDLVDRKAS